jgi:Spherulation-specific family 4
VTFLLAIPSGGISADATIVTLNFGAGWLLSLDYATGSGGTLNLGGAVAIDGPTEINGVPLLVQVANVGTGATAWLSVLALGDAASGAQVFSAGSDSGTLRTVNVNPAAADLGDTELGQIWVSGGYQSGSGDIPPAMPTVAGMVNLLNAWTGESAAARVVRLCGENGLAGRVYGYPDGSAAMGDQTIDTLANLLQYCEVSDRGLLYEPAEALGIGYRTLGSLGNQAVSVQLDYTQAHLGGDGSSGLQPVDDDRYTINDATVSRNNGSSVQVQVTTGPLSILPPPDGVGDYATQVTVYTAYDTSLPHIAGWITHIGTADQERYPSVPLNLAREELAGLVYALQDVRPGDCVQIVNPPSWLPPGPITQLVYGSAENLGGFFWNLSWNTVPEVPYEVAVAGTDASDSAHADTAGSELAAGVSATATSLSVETTQGPIWTTNSGAGSGQQAIVPLYSYPGSSSFWADVTANPGPMGMVICNVDSGPGTEYESNFAAVFGAAAAAGITCLGYVPTGYGADSIASVEDQVDLWQTYYGITSIMFDTVSPDETYLDYYTTLVEYVHARGGIAVLNPGTIPAEGYMSIGADVVQVCEDSYANFATDASNAPSWLFDYPATSISVTCNQCSTEADMVTVVGLSQSAFNAHYVWVTADGIYEAEPSYFAAEVTELGYAPGEGGDFPFDIAIAGERITVTDITGDSSPQTFSVIRSINGVVKSQDEGAAVALFHTPIAALSA